MDYIEEKLHKKGNEELAKKYAMEIYDKILKFPENRSHNHKEIPASIPVLDFTPTGRDWRFLDYLMH